MALARSLVVAEGEVAAYHCMARCVRQAHLCGIHPLTKRNYAHRKTWVRQQLETLAQAFAIEIGSYAVMGNHVHVVLKTRPDLARHWDAAEITKRWRIALPVHRPAAVLKTLFAAEVADKRLVASRRKRLSSVSWFMRCLLEPIARQANKEDGCKGRFWEERFQCVGLLDDVSILACSVYVDLNPIRAGLAKTPEESAFTSIFDRLQQRHERLPESRSADGWLSALVGSESRGKPSRRISPAAWCDLSLDAYLELVDWTGRQRREDKRGAIPAGLRPILERLQLQEKGWLLFANHFGELFNRWAGAPAKLEEAAAKHHCQRVHGLSASHEIYD